MEKYNPKEIEKKAQDKWKNSPDLVEVKDASGKEKRFILDMFPYPSGTGLHVGHVESYTATDIVSRYLRMKGYNVLHPQGFDAFGLPAENYAIKTGVHPKATIEEAVRVFKKQIDSLGFSYDWSREVNSSLPEYYKWTQWLFLLFYKNGLAYKKKAKVNWCQKCQTVLANEQAENGKCERCESEVIQKDLEQWFFKITDFIEDTSRTNADGKRTDAEILTSGLISGLDKVDWPESTKTLQQNWIGRSEGATIKFPISNFQFPNNSQNPNDQKYVEVFTTRIDTIFGCTYCVVAPEYPLLAELKDRIENWDEVEKYTQATKKKTDLDRMEAKVKTGVELKGVRVINPFSNESLPLFVADYVLAQYGTGAVMAVPAHDERDFEFAKKYDLPIKKVIIPPFIGTLVRDSGGLIIDGWQQYSQEIKDWVVDGELINSGEFSGLTSEEARKKLTTWLEEKKLGEKKINYRLRDWLVSRQRYWGAPIPIIYCEKCGEVPVPEVDLPVELPDDVDFKPTGESPLKYSEKFQNVVCPKCGAKAKRESDTMDTFVCSSWYYLRYADSKNEKEFASKELLKKWLPVDLYVGGAEHSVLHLLYARFFTKVLHNLGYLEFDEPFLKLRHQGTILAEDGTKMSKSKGNVVNPDDVVAQYGADALRCFEMFMGPLEDMKPWQTRGIVGVYRFLEKAWKMQTRISEQGTANSNLNNLLHKTIKKVSEDIETMHFNTAISQLMILANALEKEGNLYSIHYTSFLILLSPFAPHLAENLWEKLGHSESIFQEKWPEYDPELIRDEEIELVIQVNGKVRDTVKVSADISEEEATKLALESEKVKNHTSGKEIKKVIFVKGRLINIVI
ncbi:MAG: leucine--tRNA ligase [Candidatus Moranbacteria bacterium]|nr:leucine--tRNA ligase [Candidatus Moranbacteria bacterium]